MPEERPRRKLRTVMRLLHASGDGAPSLEQKVSHLQTLRCDRAASEGLDQGLIEELESLRGGLSVAGNNLAELQKLLEKMSEPPRYPAIFLGKSSSNGSVAALVKHGPTMRVVNVAEGVDLESVRVGDELLLSHALNVALAKSPFRMSENGEVATFDRYAGDGRAVLRARDEELVVQLGGALADVSLKNGDLVCWSRDLYMAFEKIERSEGPDLFLEETPHESFAAIGGLEEQIGQLKRLIALHVHNPDVALKYGLLPKAGVTFFGPPGTGKTMLARALANWLAELSVSGRSRFVSIKPGQLNSMWFGETERKIREIFRVARETSKSESNVPVVIYFDEIDSIGTARSETRHSVESRVLNALMSELDGLESRGNVLVVAATNRLSSLDEALLRPGRLGDEKIEVPRPNRRAAREVIAKYFSEDIPYDTADHHGDAPAAREALIDACVARLYAPNGATELANLTLRDGKQHTVRARDLVSGAVLAKTANDARRAACLREVQGGSAGVRLEDVHAAVSRQLESLASMLSPANAHRFLTSLPQDIDVVRVEPISQRTTARMHRYVQAA